MKKRTKKIIAIVLVIVIVGVGVWALWPKAYEKGVASIDDLLGSASARRIENMPVLVTAHEPYLALIATPIALYYEGQTQKGSPLLVVRPNEPSRAVIRFLSMYGNLRVATLGEVPTTLSSNEREWEEPTTATIDNSGMGFKGSLKDISLNVAKHFWSHSDGVVIVEPNQESYNKAIVVVPFASYLNIPVIVIDKMDSIVGDALKSLGVKYSIVCQGSSNVEGYGKTKRFASVEEAQDWMIKIVRERLGSEVNYITMANPLDIYEKEVTDSFVAVPNTTGTIKHSPATAYPGRPELGEGPCFPVNIPYKYANVKVELSLDISREDWGDDAGARIYAFFGVDVDGDGALDETKDKIKVFCGSPAYSVEGLDGDPTGDADATSTPPNPIPTSDRQPKSKVAKLNFEFPIFNDIQQHAIQLLAKIPTDSDRWPGGDWNAEYTLKVTVEKLNSYIYPRLKAASSIAGYLTAYRKGVVLAKPSYMIYNDTYVTIEDSSNPAANLNLIEHTNRRVGEVKKDLNLLLARLPDPANSMPTNTNEDIIALAKYYYPLDEAGTALRRNFTYIGIIADPSMIPHYYYPSKGLGQDSIEGYRVPSDNIYADIDADLELPPFGLNGGYPRLELADGRLTGFDVQDISALLARTFFYQDIIRDFKGVWNGRHELSDPTPLTTVAELWKDSAVTALGTEPPVGPAESAAQKLGQMWQDSGFGWQNMWPEQFTGSQGARQKAAPYYGSANFVFICAHGFYYWYVPPAIRSFAPYFEVSAGGAFDVAHVRLMNWGPSIIWTDSCVTGRIDGLDPRNCLSHAFLHAGFNCYLGGTRSMWGSLFFTPDSTSGEMLGSLMALYWYGHMCGYIYDKSKYPVPPFTGPCEPNDLPTGAALMLAKNKFIVNQGTDGGGANDDTYEEVLLHGDPAFNPYEPNHEGAE
ncbi:MAG: hypothetical protein QME47_07570 [Candidatus Thermoplasmatota archaeon]|nr:hypothetical protein [Candidatus Thermoplasmatota archaeon]